MRLLFIFCLLTIPMRVAAQADSLTISDTIGVTQQRVGFAPVVGYRYYGASLLAGNQLGPVLQRSPDPAVRRLYGQSRLFAHIATGMTIGAAGFFAGGLATLNRRRGPSGSLVLGGYVALFGSIIPKTGSQKRLAQAVSAHNEQIRSRFDDYIPPVVYAPNRPWPLSPDDSIAMRRATLTYQYTYRGIRVNPSRQLTRLIASLNDREVNDGLHYVRTVNQIGSVAGGIGRTLLTGYLTSLLLTGPRRFRRNSPLNNELLAIGLIGITSNFVLSRHANSIQRRWVIRYNDRLKQRFSAQ